MDARIDPASAYGIPLGDAHIIRNAGGSAKEALRSLVISQQLLGTNEIIVVKHTGCGMLTFQNSDAEGIVKKNLGDEAAGELKAFGSDFLAFPVLEKAVEDDVEFLKGSKLIPDTIKISGWVYEVESGKVRSVV
jgi:carbonic anhydrase